MTQFEFDQLSVMAGGWEIRASYDESEDVRRICKSHAEELRSFLRHADTIPPGPPAVTTPAPPPSAE